MDRRKFLVAGSICTGAFYAGLTVRAAAKGKLLGEFKYRADSGLRLAVEVYAGPSPSQFLVILDTGKRRYALNSAFDAEAMRAMEAIAAGKPGKVTFGKATFEISGSVQKGIRIDAANGAATNPPPGGGNPSGEIAPILVGTVVLGLVAVAAIGAAAYVGTKALDEGQSVKINASAKVTADGASGSGSISTGNGNDGDDDGGDGDSSGDDDGGDNSGDNGGDNSGDSGGGNAGSN